MRNESVKLEWEVMIGVKGDLFFLMSRTPNKRKVNEWMIERVYYSSVKASLALVRKLDNELRKIENTKGLK